MIWQSKSTYYVRSDEKYNYVRYRMIKLNSY